MPTLRIGTPEAYCMMDNAQVILRNRDGQLDSLPTLRIDFGGEFDLPDVGSLGRHAQGRIPLVDDNGKKYFLRLSAFKLGERGRWVISSFTIYDSLGGEVMLSSIYVEMFMWAVSNCPQSGNRDGQVVPYYVGNNGSFNEVTLTCREGAVYNANVAPDSFGYWEFIPVADIESFEYRSCTGSVVKINRVGDVFVVTETAEVGLTTLKRLRDAGYEGPVNRRPFTRLVCQHGHEVEVEGDAPDIIWNASCHVCTDELGQHAGMAALTEEDAVLLAKVQAWWYAVGNVNFPVTHLRVTNRGTYCRQWQETRPGDEPNSFRLEMVVKDETASLCDLLKGKGLPVEAIEALTLEELKAQKAAGEVVYNQQFEAATGVSLDAYFQMSRDSEEAKRVSEVWWEKNISNQAVVAEAYAAYALAQKQAAEKGISLWPFMAPDDWKSFIGLSS